MNRLFEPDPENLNKAEEDEITQRLMNAVHPFERGVNGRCVCGLERWSVLHWDEEADFREAHYHDGGDCMCFERE